jgi:hypothetical protein
MRHFKDLCVFYTAHLEFKMSSSSDAESCFSVVSNVVRTRPNITTRSISGYVRRALNCDEDVYLSEVAFTSADPTWVPGDEVPDLKEKQLVQQRSTLRDKGKGTY